MTRAPSPAPARLRMPAAERERQILDGAISYFAEVGFAGDTRELSRRLGITQPLLYRYFPSKQILIEKVYERVFLGRWDPVWPAQIADRSRPLRERLIAFYQQYAAATYQPEWIRIYMHAGLADAKLNQRYISLIERELLATLCLELREHAGCRRDLPVSQAEIEFAWGLHGGMFYYAVRHSVYGVKTDLDIEPHIELMVDCFLAGLGASYARLFDISAKPKNLPRQKSSGSRSKAV